MANRSYLYSADHLPESPEWNERRVLNGIAEYGHEIPLAFKILLTGNPTAHRSSIWETPEKIAIAGDYALGRANLASYLNRISDPAARPLIEEALKFLNDPIHSRKYFILECGEIFDLTEGPLGAKNSALLEEIQEIGSNIGSTPTPAPIPSPFQKENGILSRLFKPKKIEKSARPPDPLSPYYQLGLGSWSEILYFDFSQNEA